MSFCDVNKKSVVQTTEKKFITKIKYVGLPRAENKNGNKRYLF